MSQLTHDLETASRRIERIDVVFQWVCLASTSSGISLMKFIVIRWCYINWQVHLKKMLAIFIFCPTEKTLVLSHRHNCEKINRLCCIDNLECNILKMIMTYPIISSDCS